MMTTKTTERSCAGLGTTQTMPLAAGSRGPCLVLVEGAHEGWIHRMRSDRLEIGRAPDASLVLGSARVSARHAVIARQPGGGYTIEDLESRNGVVVNEIVVPRGAPHPLRHGDVVRLGDQTLMWKDVQADPAPPVQGLARASEPSSRTELVRAQEATVRARMGQFMLMVTIGLCMLSWMAGFAPRLAASLESSTLVSVPFFVIALTVLAAYVKRSGYPGAFFGITTHGWKRSLIEGVLFSLPLLAIVVAAKAVLIRTGAVAGRSLFAVMEPGGSPVPLGMLVAYVLFVPVQELISRGVVQSCFEHFLVGEHRTRLAIVFSSLVFGTAHLYISPALSAVALAVGLFWGWLYARHRTLVGVTVSHVLVGIWAMHFVDLGLSW